MSKKRTSYVIYTVLLVIVFCLFFPSFRTKARSATTKVFSVVTIPLNSLGDKIKSEFSFVTNIRKLRQQNEELAAQIVSLQVDKSQTEELKNENELLKKELGFISGEESSELIPAKIIQRDPVNFLDKIVIDKGSSSGIAEKMAVISSGTLVGQITAVDTESSTVTLITSKDSMVQAMLQNSRAKGILKGGISGLYLENIMQDTDYAVGENVVTSGLGGDIKQGILIGKAGSLESSSSSIYKTIEVEPIVAISDLELVFVQK